MALTDERLAQALQQGDRAALTTLVERHYDPLLGYLYRMTRGDRSLAQDLVQETFLRALRGIGGYKGVTYGGLKSLDSDRDGSALDDIASMAYKYVTNK